MGNDPLAVQRREEMVRYMCLDSFMAKPMPMLAEMCIKLICSISSVMHNGALREFLGNMTQKPSFFFIRTVKAIKIIITKNYVAHSKC